MYVRLKVAWTASGGRVYGPGDLVDVDAITLAELEEQGVVDNLDSSDDPAADEAPKKDRRIGPGPGVPPDDGDARVIGPGPGAPIEPEPSHVIGPGPGAPPDDGDDKP